MFRSALSALQTSARRNLIAEVRFWLLAALTGLVAGLAVVILRLAIQELEHIAFGASDERVTTAAQMLEWGRLLLAPVTGGCIVAGLLWIGPRLGLDPDGRGGGVMDVIVARRNLSVGRAREDTIKSARLTLRQGGYSALLATVSLGSGASAGREGPAVHLGAAVAAQIVRVLKLSPHYAATLLACGAAAAVSASFNAPLAGVLFAHEVILRRYRLADTGPVAVASICAALVCQAVFGASPVFARPALGDIPLSYLLAVPVFGLIAAGVAVAAVKAWTEAPRYGAAFADELNIPLWMLPPLGGLLLGLFAVAFPQVLGVGYEATAAALAGSYGWAFLIVLCVAKLAATALTIATRFGGGVFSPSLYLGAMAGGAFGAAVGALAGDVSHGQMFFAVVGMGAVSGAVLGAPISTTLIVFELTANYEAAGAVLVAVSLATVITQAVAGGSAFDIQARNAGTKGNL
jgi:CIC family chloride channel protein